MPQDLQYLFALLDQGLLWSLDMLRCLLALCGVGMVAGAVAWRRPWGKVLALGCAGLGLLVALALDALDGLF